MPTTYYNAAMKTITVRLPDALADEIEAESRKRKMSKSDIVRDRLTAAAPQRPSSLDDIADLIGSVHGLPPDLSANTKRYLRAGYGRKRPR
jgi:Ribbon-helix-helix protein, copG family